MKNSWRIFMTDLKNISKNWVAAIILGGLVFLPSLYAWLNIEAAWDPYGQTDQIPVGIINEDKGETVRDEDIHVGNELVDSLKDNNSMDWRFMKKDKAMEELEKGDLFAVVVIPENFSKNLGTVIESEPEKAEVEYYVNEKINAIAPKITEKGASVIVEEVSSNFISTVNGVIFEVFNKIGLELEKELPDIKQFEKYVFEMEKRLPEINKTLEGTLTDADSAQTLVDKAQKELPNVENTISDGLGTIDRTTEFLQTAENRLNEVSPQIKQDIANAQKSVKDINDFIAEIESAHLDLKDSEEIKDELKKQVDGAIEYVEEVEKTLGALLDQLEKAEDLNEKQIEQVESTLEWLDEIKELLTEGKGNADKIEEFLAEKSTELEDIFANISTITENAGTLLNDLEKEYVENIEPTVLGEVDEAKKTLASARGILVDVQDSIPEVKELLNNSDASLVDGVDLLEDVLEEYPYVSEKV